MYQWGVLGRLAVWLSCVLVLASCGSPSGGVDGAPPTTTKTLSLSLGLVGSDGNPISRIESGASARVTITASIRTVVSSGGRTTSDTSAPASGLIVELGSGGASFEPSSARILTDTQGSASAILFAGTTTGAQTLTATATSGDAGSANSSLNYEIIRTAVPVVSVRLLDSTGLETNTLRSGDIITAAAFAEDVTFVSGGSGTVLSRTPRPGVVVGFSSDGGVFDPASATALTDNSGRAQVRFQAGSSTGAFTLSASAALQGSTAQTGAVAYQITAPRIVLGSGNPFVAGRLSSATGDVRSGETIVITGLLRTDNGLSYTLPVDVRFSSQCASAGSASLPATARSSNGSVTVQYTPQAGCAGQDEIRAEALLPGQSIGASAGIVVTVLPPTAGAIRYVDASATQLGLLGRATGARPDRSDVRFRVTNVSGIPVAGTLVRFALSNTAGGIRMLNPTATTNSDGIATGTVLSGTRAANVRVIASIDSPAVSAQSDVLLISSGTPDQDSLSLSVETFNIEGFNFDGVTSTLTLRAADFFNNPIIDGSQAVVTTEGGAVGSACVFVAGVCSVALNSQNPRPADGRLTVLATVPGDESFTDLNGNGQYDAGEPFDDLGEAFVDNNEDGEYQLGEPFIDRNSNGLRDPGNGIYDGILCGNAGGCQSASSVDVRESQVLVFSTSGATISISPSSLQLDELSPRTVTVSISDLNGNLPPAGSTVQVAVTNGTLLGQTTAPIVGNSNARGPLQFDLQIVGDGEPSSGTLTVSLTTPRQIATVRQITVTDVSVCSTLPAPLPPGCEGGGDATVGEIEVSPTRFTVQANDSARAAPVVMGVFAGTGSTRRPFQGVTPSLQCTPSGNASNLVITEPSPIVPTDGNGRTTLNFVIDAGPLPVGQVDCLILAGDKQATVSFVAAPLTVARVIAIPSSFTVAADQTSTQLTTQIAVTADDGAGGQIPVIGVTPVIGACSNGGSSGFFIANPGSIAPTDSSGVTTLNFAVTSGPSPLGSWSCPVSVGGITVTISFAP